MDRELPDKHGVLLEMYDERAFSSDAIRELPELAAELSVEENLLHVQVGILGNAVRREVRQGDILMAPRILTFLEQALSRPRAISEIANAVFTSFVELEELQQTDVGRGLLRLMPPALMSILSRNA
jgi:hypothetical protein